MLNETIVPVISEIASTTNNLLIWGLTIILFPLMAWIYTQKAPSKNFWSTWGFVAVITGFIITLIVMNPNWAYNTLVKLQESIK
jgi:hypothetical protein